MEMEPGEKEMSMDNNIGFKVLLWNVAGIFKIGDAWEFIEKADIVILQESWIEKKDEVKVVQYLSEKFSWYFKAAIKEKGVKKGRAKGGQAIGIKKKWEGCWETKEWEFGLILSNRSIRESETIISVYNNVGIRRIEKKLRDVIVEEASQKDKILILGDMNARIGNERAMTVEDGEEGVSDARKSQDMLLNSEGKKLLGICADLGLKVLNGRTEGDLEGKVTFVGGGEECCGSVLDFAMVLDRGRANEINRLEVISRTESDHLPMVVTIRGQEAEEKEKDNIEEESENYRMIKLIWKDEKAEEFKEEMHKVIRTKEDVIQWDDIKNKILGAAKRAGLLKEYRKSKRVKRLPRWFNEECRKQRKEVWEKLKAFLKQRNHEKKKELVCERRKMKLVIKDAKEKWRRNIWEQAGKAKDMSRWWKAINNFRKKGRASVGQKVSMAQWRKHFESLLNGEKKNEETMADKIEPWDRIEQSETEEERATENGFYQIFSMKELESALREMKNGKAAGEDGIGVEFLKALSKCQKEELRGAINEIWKNGILAKGWETARIVPIYKEGDKEMPENYRGVALLDIGYKVLTKMMTKRLCEWIEKNGKLKESQAGFRRGRGTRDQIFTLNAAINKKMKEKGGKVYVAFVDFKAAFDKVNRERLILKLKQKGVTGRMLETIKGIYRETWAEVQVGENISQKFRTMRGVRQGCALSAVLFDLYIDELEDEWEKKKEGGVVIGKEKIYAIKYADDVAALAETAEGLKNILKDLEKWAVENMMEINVKKTKIMIFKNGGRNKKDEKWKIYQEEVQIVKEFKYLGFWFTSKNSIWAHGKRTASKTQKAMNTVWSIWKRAGRDVLEERLYLMNSIVRAGALYGVEIWGLGDIGIWERIQNRYCKMVLGVGRTTPNYIWRREIGVQPMEYVIRERALRYIVEVLDMEDKRWPKISLREEIRAIMNGTPTKWGKELMCVLQKMSIEDVIVMMWERKEVREIEARIKVGLENLKKKILEKEEEKIRLSTYNDKYKLIIENDTMPWKYWKEENVKARDKEIWARLRCGNIGKAGKKGQWDGKCRICNEQDETMEHFLVCNKSRELITESVRKNVEEWIEGVDEAAITGEMIKLLRGKIHKGLCAYYREIEERCKEREFAKAVE